ncbi:MAG: carbohydrate porin [Verrucomicrobiales bacterium]
MTTDADLIAAWDVLNVGQPNQGQLLAHVEGRWDYGTTGPQALGFGNLASLIGTGNAFSAYTPTYLVRNLYWEQGSPEAGWAYRIGKITPDAMLATSRHITPVTTFLSNGGTGLFANGLPDSGLGAAGVWHPNESLRILGIVSDANGDRFTFGNPGAGKFYTALELGAKIAPKTEKAGYSKLTFWRQPETGKAINGQTGVEGWGMTVKHEYEFTDDGRAVGVLRWGRSWKDAAAYKQQAGAHFLYYDPGLIGTVQNDVVGTAFNWAAPNDNSGGRDEYNLEVFYRLPLFPGLDTTISYQSVFDPAFNTEFDHAHVISFRMRTTF